MTTKQQKIAAEVWQWVMALTGESILVLALLVWILYRLIWACEWLSP